MPKAGFLASLLCCRPSPFRKVPGPQPSGFRGGRWPLRSAGFPRNWAMPVVRTRGGRRRVSGRRWGGCTRGTGEDPQRGREGYRPLRILRGPPGAPRGCVAGSRCGSGGTGRAAESGIARGQVLDPILSLACGCDPDRSHTVPRDAGPTPGARLLLPRGVQGGLTRTPERTRWRGARLLGVGGALGDPDSRPWARARWHSHTSPHRGPGAGLCCRTRLSHWGSGWGKGRLCL